MELQTQPRKLAILSTPLGSLGLFHQTLPWTWWQEAKVRDKLIASQASNINMGFLSKRKPETSFS